MANSPTMNWSVPSPPEFVNIYKFGKIMQWKCLLGGLAIVIYQ